MAVQLEVFMKLHLGVLLSFNSFLPFLYSFPTLCSICSFPVKLLLLTCLGATSSFALMLQCISSSVKCSDFFFPLFQLLIKEFESVRSDGVCTRNFKEHINSEPTFPKEWRGKNIVHMLQKGKHYSHK